MCVKRVYIVDCHDPQNISISDRGTFHRGTKHVDKNQEDY